MKVELINYTPNPEELVAKAGKLCYSSVGVEEIADKLTDEDIEKFVRHIVEIKHESVLEHISFTFAVEGVSRALANQLVRHRVASYCLSGDTEVYTDFSNRGVRKRTIKELYNIKKQYRDMTHIRGVDEDNLILINNDILDVLATGKKEVYKVRTKNGYGVKSTLEHKFYTEDGWKRLKDIKVSDKVYVNGKPLYQNKEWLKDKYYEDNLSQEEIGRLCNVSKHTIRRWIRKLSLQKELGEWSKNVEPPNKGRTKEDYEPMRVTSEKMLGNSNYSKLKGEEHHSYKEDISDSGGYGRVLRNYEREYTCNLCGKETKNTEVHHIDLDPTNDKLSNLEELCVTCHKVRHRGSVVRTIILDEIESIEYYGEEETYDISMKAPHHNFIANGFVVHNSQQSQRYVKLEQFEYVIPTSIKNIPLAKEIFIENMENSQRNYDKLVNMLMVKELFENYSNKFKDIVKCNPEDYRVYDLGLDGAVVDLYRTLFEGSDIGNYHESLYKNILEDVDKKTYSELEKKAIEDARYVFPNATETKIVFTMNARSLMNFFKLRCCVRSQDEIRTLAHKMLKLVKEVAPNVFDKAGASCMRGYCPEGDKTCGRLDKIERREAIHPLP